MKSRNYPWLSTLLSYFKTIKKYDIEIESFRSSLCSLPNFSPVSIFSYLDQNLKSFLTIKDLNSFLESQNSKFNENYLRKLIHNFDKDGDFSLNLHEFSCLILSKKKNKNEKFSSYRTEINDEVKMDLKNILEKEMELIKELNDIAKEIKNSKIFSTYEAFMVIVGGDKYITKNNLGKFMNDNYMEINEDDLKSIMFRIDSDNDDKISYEEFKEIFYPLKEEYSTSNDINNDYNINENKEEFIFNDRDITSKYLSKEFDNENNLDNNENKNNIINENKEDNKINEEENKDLEDNNNMNENKGKKKKITKKTILKPKLQSNLNQNKDINNDNSSTNYILKSKCSSCGVPKKESDFNISTNKYLNEEKEFSIPKSDNIINNIDEEKDSNNINLRSKPNIINNIPKFNMEFNHDHKDNNCKACLYTAKNIYNDFREKNNSNNPFTSREKFTFRKMEDNKEDEDILLKNNNNDNLEESKEDEITNIYKNKEELLKKYGIKNTEPEKNTNYSSYNFSSKLKSTSLKIDNDNDNNIINSKQQINEEKEEISNLKSENKYSSNNTNYFDNNNTYNSPLRSGTNNNKTYIISSTTVSNPLSGEQKFNIIPKNNINEKKELLFKLFVDIVEKESNIEKIKASLSSCQDATPKSIFELFNKNNKYTINGTDILETLKSLSSNDTFNQDDLKYIFKKYNRTTSNGFTFDEFCKIIFPKNFDFNNNKNNEEINLEENTKNIIVELFKEIIEGEKSIENNKILLDKEANNIYFDLFEEIKKREKNGIQGDDIDKFMKEYGYELNENDIDLLMNRFDSKKIGVIDYGEFIDEIRPMNFC